MTALSGNRSARGRRNETEHAVGSNTQVLKHAAPDAVCGQAPKDLPPDFSRAADQRVPRSAPWPDHPLASGNLDAAALRRLYGRRGSLYGPQMTYLVRDRDRLPYFSAKRETMLAAKRTSANMGPRCVRLELGATINNHGAALRS